jgi:hypothetical protein
MGNADDADFGGFTQIKKRKSRWNIIGADLH